MKTYENVMNISEHVVYGIKSKCVLKIVPHDEKCETLEVDEKCLKKRH